MLYPDIFVKPKDVYMKILLREILDDFESNDQDYIPSESDKYENMVAYLGNMHVSAL